MMKKKYAAFLAAALLVAGMTAEAVDVSSYPVNVPEEYYVKYTGENPAFQGGFLTGFGSALTVKSVQSDGTMEFYALTDRGPNGDSPQYVRDGKVVPGKYFPAPAFQPEIAVLKVQSGQVSIENVIGLKNSDGTAISGLPPAPGSAGATGETALSENGKPLPYDNNGLDPEGIAVDQNGHFWISDEYGPFAMEFDKQGKLLKKYGPGTGLPEILAHRTPNRGAEGLTTTPNGTVVVMEQSTLNLKQGKWSSAKAAAFTRLVFLDPKTGATKTYAYPINDDYKKPGNAKLGDIAAINDHEFLIIEQGKDKNKVMQNRIYKIDVSGADDISHTKINGLEPEYYPNGGGIRMAKKELLLDLRAHGWVAEKAEGLAILPDKQTLAVINDNDFGVAVKLTDSAHPKAEVTDYVLRNDPMNEVGSYTLDGKPAFPKFALEKQTDQNEWQTKIFFIRLDQPLA